ncbi:MAG: elongation factor G [Bacteroidota bacterium]|nr:elongation factor G [Bacteroidota bacterium]MDP4234489.1 elongation factor G [Bacteroidota bacterium]MDP4243861.1 elongation factor G [Bacteroidota bacterium]MDP4288803.1 elongation factor G [Bacteroidota bacterium]
MGITNGAHIRNLALVGHAGSGKTTLAEGIAFAAGLTNRRGTILEGSTLSDYHPDEIARKHSINTSLISLTSGSSPNDTKLNLLDSPGYADFVGEVRAALHVADTALMVVDAQHGVEAGTATIWQFCAHDQNSVIFIANKLDHIESHFDDTVAQLKSRFGHEVAVAQFPLDPGEGFSTIIDIVKMKALKFAADGTYTESAIPASVQARADELHRELVEIVAESDDALMEEFFANDGKLEESHLSQGLKASLAHRRLFPVLCASAEKNIGTRRVLDFIIANAPAPEEHIADVHGVNPDTKKEVSLNTAPKDATTLFVFKTVSETHLGDLSFFRVFHGELHPGTDLVNESNGKTERIAQLFVMSGKNRKEMTSVPCGDIAAAVKLKDTHTNNTLSSKSFPVVLTPIDFPAPVITSAVQAKNKGDEEKVALGMHTLHEEDPTFIVRLDPELHQMLIEGQGELHLDIAVKRLRERYKVDVEIVEPRIPFRETIKSPADTRYRHKKQSGGAGQFGEVAIKLQPRKRGEGYEFIDAIVGGVISGKHIPAVDKGIHEFLKTGPLAGYPVVDLAVTLYDGKEHPVDSNENAFKTAGKMAFKEAFLSARPVLLEPICDVEVAVPGDHMGDVMGDISSRRGKIIGMDSTDGLEVIRAQVPLAELYHYSTRLRSLTQGRAQHKQSFSHYEEAPRDVAEKIVAEAAKHHVAEVE